jgi:uncharacterized delta-60 repeat protein
MAIQPDGKIVVAGRTENPFTGIDSFAIARYNVDGSLDSSFGVMGRVTTDFGGVDTANGISIQADGKIVVAGQGGPNSDFALARYNADASLDMTFGTGGKVLTDFGRLDAANDVAIQTDGKIVAAGVGGELFALARYNDDGSPDVSFGVNGKVTTEFFGENIESATALAIQTDGKIVAIGSAISDFDPSFAIARYNKDGTLDSSFGAGGMVITDFGDPSDVGVLCPPARKDCSEDIAEDVVIQPDGRIIVVGGAGPGTPPPLFALARYLGDTSSVIEVTVDIKPGAAPNTVNPRSRGVIPVAVLSSDSFDAASIDPLTVQLGPGGASESHGRGHFEDVNMDGRPDLVLHFRVGQTGIQCGDLSASLIGETFAGQTIEGSDSFTTVGCR